MKDPMYRVLNFCYPNRRCSHHGGDVVLTMEADMRRCPSEDAAQKLIKI
jgi:hypothetical protein